MRHKRVRKTTPLCLRCEVSRLLAFFAAAVVLVVGSRGAKAAVLYDENDLQIRWDNSFRYTAAVRLTPRSKELISDPNADDGDRNFHSGLVSDRLDLLTEFDISDGAFGFHVSAAGWYDSVYHERNDNDSPATFNPSSVPHNAFTHATRTLHGEDVELVDAFAHDTFNLGESSLSIRLGRGTMLWGESVFFAEDGIAAGQAPIDEIKELSAPTTYAKQTFLPVDQASVSVDTPVGVTLSAYYQFEWRKDRLPGSGSFFSAFDYLDAGGERYIFAPGKFLLRLPDQRPPELGQFGVALEWGSGDFNFGLYALRFNAKEPQIYLRPDNLFAAQNVGTYNLAYPEGISLYGASFSGYLWDYNVAGEVSVRTHMPLGSNPITVPSGTLADNGARALYPIGDTLHAQVSTVDTLAPNAIWQSADLAVELASVERLNVTRNRNELDPTRTPFSLSMRATLTPRYFEVLPGLDLSLPLGVGFGLAGNSSTVDTEYANSGDVEVGVGLTYLTVWNATLSFTTFIGSADKQPLGDRDFLSLNIQRAF